MRLMVIFLASLFFSTAHAESYRWLQYTPGGIEARAITDQPACPAAQIDGAAATMTLRAEPDAAFPVRVCALAIPATASAASVDSVPLALPSAQLKRIAVIGDTGCRMKGDYVQACNDPTQWPFPLITQVVAQFKPDLVIHVGDYHYRETPCPGGDKGCAGSPSGDNWAVWRADFFVPAATLLEAVPWVFVRGNHEECRRGGHGWSRTLEPFAFDAQSGCNGIAKPFAARLPGLTLVVMDVAGAREDKADDAQAAFYHEQYQAIAQMGGPPVWLLAHRPVWSPGGKVGDMLLGDNKTLEAAANGRMPDNVTMMLSGHHHLFQVLSYAADLPVQVISGHGGDYLNPRTDSDPTGWVVGGITVKSGVNITGTFGFSMLEKRDDGWQLAAYDRLGGVLESCSMKGRDADCKPGAK
ncbi:MAG TPA: metallophosphoesterase [Pseudolabrys sp.]|nr:metallophosphoesterase [Pseudolabrys sp.]